MRFDLSPDLIAAARNALHEQGCSCEAEITCEIGEPTLDFVHGIAVSALTTAFDHAADCGLVIKSKRVAHARFN